MTTSAQNLTKNKITLKNTKNGSGDVLGSGMDFGIISLATSKDIAKRNAIAT